jgi:adenylate cyclase, class 2
MGDEHEITILDVKRSEVLARLRKLKAKHAGSHRFRRVEFLLKGNVRGGHSWGRVRTNGDETTITLKETRGRGGFTSMKEYEVKADNFEEAARIMTRLVDSRVLVYFENERDAYKLGSAQVTIDKWPRIPAFVEIEAPSMAEVKRAYKRLGISGRFVGNLSIHKIYGHYGLSFEKVMAKNRPKLDKLLGRPSKQ